MTDKWLTMPEAAVALEISTRTLQRRISKSWYPTRCQTDGRREVLADTPGDTDGQVADTLVQARDRQLQLAGGTIAAWQKLADTADTQTLRSRRVAAGALSIVTVLASALLVGTWWSTKTITGIQTALDAEKQQRVALGVQLHNLRADAQAQASTLRQQLADRGAEADRLASDAARIAIERDRLRDELVGARQALDVANAVLDAQKQRLAAADQTSSADMTSVGP